MTLPSDYLERIYAGVLGKMIGVYSGRPFENWTYERIMAELGPVDRYLHERFDVPLVVTDDDLAGTFTFTRALADNGYDPELGAGQVGDTWLNYLVEGRSILWWGGFGNSTEETAWRRLKAGIRAPASGSITTNGQTVAEQIGAQIFIDGWAMMSPGKPEQAARLARAAAEVSHDGEAVNAAVLLAVIEAAAFVERDLGTLIETGLRAIPANCLIAKVVADVRHWSAEHSDWRQTRERIKERYGYHLYPGMCHVVPNLAVVVMALMHGGDEFDRVLMIANTAGWDTDCNAGNAGCLTGIRLGLASIDEGTVGAWRGPVEDRVYLPSADGGAAISDAVRISYDLFEAGHRLAGQALPALPKDGARFHFSLPGSVQGFSSEDEEAGVENVLLPNGERVLAMDCGKARFVSTPTFAQPDVERMRTYEMTACPTLYPGQTVHARLSAQAGNRDAVAIALGVLVYAEDDQPQRLVGPATSLSPGETATLMWQVPPLDGLPISRVGVHLEPVEAAAGGVVHLDRLGWTGEASTTLRKPNQSGSFWRKAWVNAVSHFSDSFPEAFRLSQNEGTGLLIQGTREWQNYRVEATVTVCLGSGGLAARVQGLRRYYLLMLTPDNRLRLLKQMDTETRILGDVAFRWELDVPVTIALVTRGPGIQAEVDGQPVIDITDEDRPLLDGAIALAVQEGTLCTDAVRVTPAVSASIA